MCAFFGQNSFSFFTLFSFYTLTLYAAKILTSYDQQYKWTCLSLRSYPQTCTKDNDTHTHLMCKWMCVYSERLSADLMRAQDVLPCALWLPVPTTMARHTTQRPLTATWATALCGGSREGGRGQDGKGGNIAGRGIMGQVISVTRLGCYGIQTSVLTRTIRCC